MDGDDAGATGGEAATIRRLMFTYREIRERLSLQFAEGDRLDSRLDSSLRLSGGAVALFGGAIVIALNAGQPSAPVETALTISILAAAAIFVGNAAVAGFAYTAASGLSAGAEAGDLIDQEYELDDEWELIWWAITTNEAAISLNTGRLRRKSLLVTVSFALTSAATVVIASGTAWAVLS